MAIGRSLNLRPLWREVSIDTASDKVAYYFRYGWLFDYPEFRKVILCNHLQKVILIVCYFSRNYLIQSAKRILIQFYIESMNQL